MNKQAGAPGAGLLASIGIAREPVARGRMTDRPMEAVTKPYTNGPINPRRSQGPSPESVTLFPLPAWFASRFCALRTVPAAAKEVPEPALRRHHLADCRRLNCRAGPSALRHRLRSAERAKCHRRDERTYRDYCGRGRKQETGEHDGESMVQGWTDPPDRCHINPRALG
jgi:hypothetical protein